MRIGRVLRVVVLAGMLVGVARAQLMPAPPTMPPVPSAPDMPSPPPMPSPGDGSGPPAANPQPQGSQGQGNNGPPGMGFVGAWCAQGDPTKQASISYNGAFFNLTNESGSTSIGNLQGSNQIQAPGWEFVTGVLSRDGTQINWSNGSYWARCPTPGGGRVSLNGTWYPNGNRSVKCSIQDRHGSLMLQNENGQRASGTFNGKFAITTNWQGTAIHGTVSRDGNRINWDNGTYWVRYRLYTQ